MSLITLFGAMSFGVGLYCLMPILRLFLGDRVYEPTLGTTTRIGIVTWLMSIAILLWSMKNDQLISRQNVGLHQFFDILAAIFIATITVLYIYLGAAALKIDQEMKLKQRIERDESI